MIICGICRPLDLRLLCNCNLKPFKPKPNFFYLRTASSSISERCHHDVIEKNPQPSKICPGLEMIRDSYTIDFTNEIKVLLILYGSLMHYVLLRC